MWKKYSVGTVTLTSALSYVAGPDQHHVICLFPMFSPTPDDGCAGDFVVASHTGLPEPWVVAPMAPLDIGDVWLGNAPTVHRGGICPTTNPHRPRVFGFISVGTSMFDYNNTCPVVVPPWAGKAAASPEGSQGPHATCGAVGCEVLLDVSDATTVFCVTCGNAPFVNRPFESEIHGTVNFTQFCCVLLVTWCYRVLLSCYLRPK